MKTAWSKSKSQRFSTRNLERNVREEKTRRSRCNRREVKVMIKMNCEESFVDYRLDNRNIN